MERLWPIITVLGPVLLAAAVLWAYIRNKKQGPEAERRADAGARAVYAEEDRRSDI